MHFEFTKKRPEIDQTSLKTFPPALIKSLEDPMHYEVILKNGLTILFNFAEYINEEWVTLHSDNRAHSLHKSEVQYNSERGIDVKVSEICCAKDVPYGT